MLWFLLIIMFASLVLLGVAFFYWFSRQVKSEDPGMRSEESEVRSEVRDAQDVQVFDEGSYTYEGVWDDDGSDPQPCRLSFTKTGGRLKDCMYTNLKWSTTIRLSGEERGETLRFTGKIGNEDLVITVAPEKGNLKTLTGTGIDYAHQGGSKVLKLYALEDAEPSSSSSQQMREGGAGPSIEADNPARSNGVTLSGSIGQYNVHMDLDIDGSNVTGSYYYRSSGSGARLYLRGTLYSDGEMVLNETNANGERTGHFDGTYRRGRSYEGLFENYRGDVLSFTLIE